jgi:hypothetical protein
MQETTVKRTTLACMTVLLLCGAGPAHAQLAPSEPQGISGTPGWVFTPAIGLGALWDSNTTLRVKGDPPLQEWAGLVSPRGSVDYTGRLTRFGFGYSGSLEAYRTLSELTRYDQRGRLNFRHRATPRLTFDANSSLSLSPTTDRLELGSLPFENVGSTLYDANVGSQYALSKRTTLTGQYELQWIDFQDVAGSTHIEGGYSNSGIGMVRHALTSRFSIGGNYEYRRANTDGGRQNTIVHDSLAIVAYRLAEHTSIEGGAGLAHLKVLETGETRSGPSLRALFSHTIDRTRVDLNYERSFIPSWGFGGTTTNEEVRASVHVPITPRLFIEGGGAFRRNEPLITTGDGLFLHSWWTGGTVGYSATRWMRVEGFYSGNFQRSSAAGEVDRVRVGILVVTLKPVRIQ